MTLDFLSAHQRYLPFVRLVAASYPERYRDDLEQEGLWGLYLGVCAFDPERGVPFDAYIKVCIRNRIASASRGFALDGNLVSLETVSSQLLTHEVPMDERFAETDALREAFRSLQPRLSELERNVLELYLSGYNCSQVARRLDISAKSADNAMTRIKKKIRDHVPFDF